MSIYETCKPIIESITSIIPIRLIGLIVLIFIFTRPETSMISLLIPYMLLVILYLVIDNISKIEPSGILFIDYFSIRQLDVTFACIFGFIMILFLLFTIIFAYNDVYAHANICHPLMIYFGERNSQTCMRMPADFENFENRNQAETFIDKFQFLSEIVKRPFIQIYLGYLAIMRFLINTIVYIKTSVDSGLTQFFTKQTEIADKLRTIFVEPLMIQVTDPLFKIIQLLFDRISNK